METINLNEIWANVLKTVKTDYIKEEQVFSFDAIVGNSKLKNINIEKNSLVIIVENNFKKNIIESEFINQLREGANKITSTNYNIVLFTEKKYKEFLKGKNDNGFENIKPQSDSLNPRYSLESFVASKSNKMLYTAAMSVAIKPGNNWNPFFIYGSSGLGKTHLLHAIGNYAKDRNPNFTIKYIEAKDFGSLVTKAAMSKNAGNRLENIKDEFANYDMLLIDDIQFIQTMPKVKELFFGIFSFFIEQGKQIVLTSDQYPEELKDFEERFITRFKSGLLLSVLPPDVSTAKKILKNKIEGRKDFQIDSFDESALEFLAINFGSSVRELEGALNRIILWTITNEDISGLKLENVTTIFEGMYNKKNNLSAKRIIQTVGKYYGITENNIIGKGRTSDVMLARHISVYFCRTMLDLSLIDIGRSFNRDHTTIINSVKRIESDRNENQDLNIALFEIRKQINK
ncbi:MAG: chromosomal replication initiator protein DnaA [Mycoplasmataceae bacterium]|nr:chromosomal replication initiator protein DnaA [Mycoplasmataceae bacterium]